MITNLIILLLVYIIKENVKIKYFLLSLLRFHISKKLSILSLEFSN